MPGNASIVSQNPIPSSVKWPNCTQLWSSTPSAKLACLLMIGDVFMEAGLLFSVCTFDNGCCVTDVSPKTSLCFKILDSIYHSIWRSCFKWYSRVRNSSGKSKYYWHLILVGFFSFFLYCHISTNFYVFYLYYKLVLYLSILL